VGVGGVATTRATGLMPSRSATLWRVSTSAAAPSEIDEALAAVIVPSLAKAGLEVGIFRGVALGGLLVLVDGDCRPCGPPRPGRSRQRTRRL
jgi:hypothetical protein